MAKLSLKSRQKTTVYAKVSEKINKNVNNNKKFAVISTVITYKFDIV